MPKDQGFNLFADVVVEESGPSYPLGGIHSSVIEANGTGAEGGMGWSTATKARWGVMEVRKNKGWKSLLQKRTSLKQLESRPTKAKAEFIVSREVDGSWLTGAADHPRDAVLEMLKREGYVQVADERLPFERIERFEKRD